MKRLATFAILLTVVAGCAPKEKVQSESRTPETCVGGFLAKRGLTPWPTCIIPFTDGGKSCSDKAGCVGQCLVKYDGNLKAMPAIGSPAIVQCQAEEPAIGCFAQVRNGTVATAFLCTD